MNDLIFKSVTSMVFLQGGVPMDPRVGAALRLFDLDAVEVLRGPHDTKLLLGSGRRAIVLVFRGTASRASCWADRQVLPTLRKAILQPAALFRQRSRSHLYQVRFQQQFPGLVFRMCGDWFSNYWSFGAASDEHVKQFATQTKFECLMPLISILVHTRVQQFRAIALT